jgi:hypothetical protein
MNLIGNDPVFLFIDDYYYIPKSLQPAVADYLHRLFKGLNVWMKIGSVQQHLKLFVAGDPPIGMEEPHDISVVRLDASLEEFDETRRFLEKILSDILEPLGVSVGHLIADTARVRLVLASGGVPRDYLYLVAKGLEQQSTKETVTRISSETINEAAPILLEQKWRDLHNDVDPDGRSRLIPLLGDIQNFCLKKNKNNVFLISSEALEGTEWGHDIKSLSELRLVHKVGSITVKTSMKEFVGVRYSAFCLDLSAYAGTRVRSIKQVEFWTAEGKQKMRAKGFVYEPKPQEPDDETSSHGFNRDQLPLWS